MPIKYNTGAVYNQWTDFPAATQLDISTVITLCCWINATSWPSNWYCDYLSKNNFYMLNVDGSKNPCFTLKLSDSNWHNAQGGGALQTDIWYHIAGTYDKNAAGNNQIIYLDGQARASNRETLSILTDPTSALSVGRNGAALGSENARYFHGKVEDARVYNRALTPNEITTLYNCRGCDSIIYGMVFRALLNEKETGAVSSGSGTCKDNSSYTDHGTSSNSPVYADSTCKYRKGLT